MTIGTALKFMTGFAIAWCPIVAQCLAADLPPLKKCEAGLPPLPCKTEMLSPNDLRFCKHLAVGQAPKEGDPTLLVFEGEIPRWGKIVSVEMATFRNSQRACDINTYSMGVNSVTQPGKLSLKFQLLDRTVDAVQKNDYFLDAHLHFEPTK